MSTSALCLQHTRHRRTRDVDNRSRGSSGPFFARGGMARLPYLELSLPRDLPHGWQMQASHTRNTYYCELVLPTFATKASATSATHRTRGTYNVVAPACHAQLEYCYIAPGILEQLFDGTILAILAILVRGGARLPSYLPQDCKIAGNLALPLGPTCAPTSLGLGKIAVLLPPPMQSWS